MWSFATHAGAGMAIAGLTATYYALSRRNYQGERERMAHESGFGDGPQVNRLRKHNENDQLSSSQMLLKKELEELSVLNGSGSGLNILYQHKTPLNRFHRSNFEITPIVSRVDTRPSTIYTPSEEEIGKGTSSTGEESVFGSKPNIDNESNMSIKEDLVSEDLPNLPLVDVMNEEKPVMDVKVSEKGDGDVTNDKNEMDDLKLNADSSENDGESISSDEVKQSETVAEKSVQESQSLKRTTSPICFFKNPGFGSRFAVDLNKKEPSPLVARLSASKINVISAVVEDPPPQESSGKDQLSPSEHCQNSTQFILSPDLSKSNVSLCEAENPEKLIKRRRKLAPTDNVVSMKTIVDTNPVQEMSDYNKTLRKKANVSNSGKDKTQSHFRRRADPNNFNSALKRTNKPCLIPCPEAPGSDRCKNDNEISNKQNDKIEVHEEKVLQDDDDKNDDRNNNDPIEKSNNEESGEVLEESLEVPSLDQEECPVGSLSTTRTSSIITGIPRDSWIALPVRIYTNSMGTLPWSLIGFCIMVVVFAGILGIFLSKLASSISHRHNQDGKL